MEINTKFLFLGVVYQHECIRVKYDSQPFHIAKVYLDNFIYKNRVKHVFVDWVGYSKDFSSYIPLSSIEKL